MTWGIARYVVRAPLSGLLSRMRKGSGAMPGPAGSTETKCRPDTTHGSEIGQILTARAYRLHNRNREAAERYLAVHRALSRGS